MVKVGTDIVSVERVKVSIERFGDRFLDRVLLKSEQRLISKVESVAGFWAAKEAISKALGCGIGKELSFLDIEIKKREKGEPYFELRGSKFKIESSSLSISHEKEFAIAVAVLVLED
jgi:holo-[acyl-carrier protein] synthase